MKIQKPISGSACPSINMHPRALSRKKVIGILCIAGLTSYGSALFVGGAGIDSAAQAASHKRLVRSDAAGTATVDTGATPASNQGPQTMTTDQQIAHLLNRITFGARPGDLEAVKAEGIKNYLASQLNPSSIAESQEVIQQVQNTPQLQASPGQLIAQYRQIQKQRKDQKQQSQNGEVKDTAEMQNVRKKTMQALVQTRLVRAIDSKRQLQEVMTDFWYNHFNISIDKGLDHALVGAYEEQAIRPYALGRFRDLLGATCHHPAMLFYLDNWQNSKAGMLDRKGKEIGINENYARELMELHTLGVDGGYTQKDVQELARVLTGLGLAGPRMAQATGGGMWGYFNSNNHDFGDKVVLGQRIAGTGEQEIEQALDMLARHPATAHHIAYQLAQYFVADNPPASLVDKLAAKFSQSDGSIKAVMTALLDSPEFWDGRYNNDKYKNPFRYIVSVFRATKTEPQDYTAVAQFLRMQGQPMYGCLTPDGYKNTQSAWLNPDALMNRINFATMVGSGKAKFLNDQPVEYTVARDTVNGGKLSAHTEAVIGKAPGTLKLALLMGSPEFMRY
jgi:uncharacterized protein (DUF1800 family)